MIILGLDISAHLGWATLEDGKLTNYGYYEVSLVHGPFIEDIKIMMRARLIRNEILHIIKSRKVDYICIEQTNQGAFRGAQKLLEFTHCLLLDSLVGLEKKGQFNSLNVGYVDSSKWRSKLGIRMSKEQLEHNKQYKKLKAAGTKPRSMSQITKKHLAVDFVNKKYNLDFKLKDNDIADAICVAAYAEAVFNKKIDNVDTSLIYKW